MAAYNEFVKLKVLCLLIILLIANNNYAAKTEFISNKRLCADKECTVVISKGKALTSHLTTQPFFLSFRKNDIIFIKSKSAGSNPRLWGGEVNGKRGYFDRYLVREISVFVSEPQYLVNTEAKKNDVPGRPPHLEKIRREKGEKVNGEEAQATVEVQMPSTQNNVEPVQPELKKSLTGEGDLVKTGSSMETENPVNSDIKEHVQGEDSSELDKKDPDVENEIISQMAENSENEEFWDDLDNGYFETERDRFDTSGFVNRIISSFRALNQFVKKRLNMDAETNQEEVKNVDANFHISPSETLEDKNSVESPEDESAKPLLYKPSPDDDKSPDALADNNRSTDEPDSVASVNVDESHVVQSVDADSSAEEPAGDASVDVSAGKVDAEPPGDESTVEIPEISAESDISKLGSEESLDAKTVDDATSDEQPKTDSADTPPRPEVSEDKETEKSSVEETKTEENISDNDSELTVDEMLVMNGGEEKKSEIDQRAQLSKEDSKDPNMFPIEDEEENEIGAEIPLYDPLSMSSIDSSQKVETPQNEAQAVKIPTAEYSDLKKEHQDGISDVKADEQNTNEAEHLVKDPVDTAGPLENLKPNIIDVDTNKNMPSVSAANAVEEALASAAVVGVSKLPGVQDLVSETHEETGEEKKESQINQPLTKESSPTADSVQMDKVGEKERSLHENIQEEVSESKVNNVSPEVKPDTLSVSSGSIVTSEKMEKVGEKEKISDENVQEKVSAGIIDNVTPELKPDTPPSSVGNIVTSEVKPEAPSSSIGNIPTSETRPETPPDSVDENITSEVRPDTPSGESPEQGQTDVPVAAEVINQGDMVSAEAEEETIPLNDMVPEKEPILEKSTNPVDLDHFQRDEKDVIHGGFAAFLQPSSSEPQQLDNPSRTPDLDSAGVVLESISSTVTAAADINYSKGDEGKVETAERQAISPDVPDKDKLETVVEGGSTLIFDAEGNFISVVLEDVPASLSAPRYTSTADRPSVTPTSVEEATVSVAVVGGGGHVPLKSSAFSEVSNNTVLVSSDVHLLDTQISDTYRSSDFSSRKVLSVNNHPHDHAAEQDHHHQHDQDHHHHDHDHLHHHHNGDHHHKHEDTLLKVTPTLDPSPTSELVRMQSEEVDTRANVQGEHKKTEQAIDNGSPLENQPSTLEVIKDEASQNKAETSTQPSQDFEIPAPPVFSGGDDSVPTEFDSGNTYHSRKMNVDELTEEEVKQPSLGLAKSVILFVELPAKIVIERLPPSLQSLLEQEPVGLSPVMTVLVALFSICVLLIGCITSTCTSGGKKQKLRATIDVITELEAKLQLAIKEKENIEDFLKEFKAENIKLKEEMSKQKKDSGKNQTELQTIQLHNETLKKQVRELEDEIQAVKENANAKQGEVKQTNKKTKEMEKNIKKLEEREKKIDQENKKLTSELRHKDEELVSLQSKVNGLNEQVGHLQTSKEQLLSEAEDWKEKVSDLKERLEQREEEFKQMQENIMFKENELEVLKDCFLHLKSFEEVENELEDGEDTSQRIQEKLSAMMDVSKVNASLLAVEEERNMLANRLQIENEARKELEEQLENSRRSVESSMADKMKAERQCQEAQTKLNVLSSYFKEKELQLQRELGEQEALKKQNLNKLVSADETTRSMQQEVEIYRTQVESLKRELASSERDFHSQIATNEKKAHENWLAARAAERELKEARHEAGVLRQKLTNIERREMMGPGGLIRPLPTRGLPLPGMLPNGPPPLPGSMDRSPSRGSMPPLPPPPHLREEEFLRRGPPHGIRPPPPDARSPPLPPFGDARSPPPRMPPPGMMDRRSPPPYDRRPLPPHMMDRRSPPFRLPPPEMLSHPMRGGPLPPPPFSRGGGSPSSGADSPHLDRADGRYPPPYARNPMLPPDRPSPRGSAQRQQQSQV